MKAPTWRRAAFILTGLIGCTLIAGALALSVTGISPSDLLNQGGMRRPSELIRYAKTRLQGHDKLEFLFLPVLHAFQRSYERPVDGLKFETFGKGQNDGTTESSAQRPEASRVARTPEEFQAALKEAKPGQVIELAQGIYRFNQKIRIGEAGQPHAPVIVRGAKIGSTIVEFNAVEGFLVNQPYWTFRDLTIRGVCKSDDDCEHAFHVVGKADHTKLVNNRIEDFNAHIKVNGFNGDWPDHGLLSQTTLTNTRPRMTLRSVTPFDLVGASFWRVTDNLVSNFVKGEGNKVSFGVFMKGASEGGRIERNLVICSLSNISQPGVRVGISFGGGGTDPSLCRDGSCRQFEHSAGLAANNIVAHCNDSGLDINRSSQITLGHNTLINTSGIDARRGPADGRVYGNLYEGSVRARDGSTLKSSMDRAMNASAVFESPDEMILKWRDAPENIPSLRGLVSDFCGQLRNDGTPAGALIDATTCPTKQIVQSH